MSLFKSFFKKKTSDSQNGKWRVGSRIEQDYEIRQVLGGEGKSGMGIVYICYYTEHQRIYALKTIQEKFIFSEENQKLFEREAIIWTELEKYPYIVQARYVVKLQGRLFIALEYIEPDQSGKNTLTQYLENLSFLDTLKFSIQFCYGMEYAYSKGIGAHRDIKPDNIMITPDKTVKITDFGLAKVLQEIQLKEDIISNKENPSLSVFRSKGKNICGTLPYMAPEQFDGYADKRSDIYSFGITLYEMVTGGQLPFIGRTQEEYERLHRYENVAPLSSPLFPIIQRCLEKETDKRYQDFVSIREELQNLFLKKTGRTLSPPEPIPDTAQELVFRGFALDSLGRYLEGLSCYDRALELDPAYGGLQWCRGDTLVNLNRLNEAISCYNAEIGMNTAYVPKAEFGKVFALILLDRYQEAMECSSFLKEMTKDLSFSDRLLFFARSASKVNGHYVELRSQVALKCINEVIRLEPYSLQSQQLKQLILQKSER